MMNNEEKANLLRHLTDVIRDVIESWDLDANLFLADIKTALETAIDEAVDANE